MAGIPGGRLIGTGLVGIGGPCARGGDVVRSLHRFASGMFRLRRFAFGTFRLR